MFHKIMFKLNDTKRRKNKQYRRIMFLLIQVLTISPLTISTEYSVIKRAANFNICFFSPQE